MLDCLGAPGQPCQLCSSRKVGLAYALGHVWAWVWVRFCTLPRGHGKWDRLGTVAATVGVEGPAAWAAPVEGRGRPGTAQCPLCHLCLPSPSSPCPVCLLAEASREVLMREHSGDAAGRGRGWYQDPSPQQLSWPDSCHLGTRGLPALGPASPPRSLARLVAEGRPARCLPGQERSGPTLCCHDPVQTQVTHVLPSPWPLL